ncbi:Na+/H+ antiporter NhaC family protein [Salisaeta longa]|uniref:Na+/H+ antiporter NhaC family protein n=1 Tax=Salisaeta longa TaxID=503170 RepID=UPI0003B353E5|nr:Na+/H+ antiporter NhaC family protein [Salisaeta longa]
MDWLVLLPPVVAIVLVLWTRQVFLGLLAGVYLGTTLLVGGNPLAGLREMAAQIVAVFQSESSTRVLLFSLLVGSLIALVQVSGGVRGFIAWTQRRGWGQTRRSAELLAWCTGVLVFVESNLSSLTVGSVARPFFDRLNLPREKLAYYCDATCAPVCMSIPFNGWGAYVLGLIAAQGVTTGAVALLAEALLYNFFAWFAIGFALVLALTGAGFGAMRTAEARAAAGQLTRPGSQPMVDASVADIEPPDHVDPRPIALIAPLGLLVAMVLLGLWITGGGSIMQGSGSTAVYWGVAVAVAGAMGLYALPHPFPRGSATLSISTSMEWAVKGASGLVPVILLLLLAFTLGNVADALQMGAYVVSLVGSGGPTWWVPAAVYLAGAVISFTLGSSWTAFALMVPVALPLAAGVGLPPPLLLGAVLSGGLFGDHASPLSDTSIIASMASACDHVDHVRTQMPYALCQAGAAGAAFLVAGYLMA